MFLKPHTCSVNSKQHGEKWWILSVRIALKIFNYKVCVKGTNVGASLSAVSSLVKHCLI